MGSQYAIIINLIENTHSPNLKCNQMTQYAFTNIKKSIQNPPRPNLKCTQFAKYKKEYEDQINLAEANIDEAVRQCDAVVAKHESLLNEKGELELALAGGASSVQDIINKTERLEAARNDVAKQLDDCNKRVKGEEDLITGIEQSSIKVTSDANRLRDEITNLENECAKCEEDKSTKDNQIMTLREEIAHQDDLISKLQKEKKGAGEGRQRSRKTSRRWRTGATT